MNTIENNKMIAEFMGSNLDGLEPFQYEDELQYHESWDWLMSVVNKIRSVDYKFDIEQISVFDCDENNPTYISHYEFDLDITYKAVVEFINQHNESTN